MYLLDIDTFLIPDKLRPKDCYPAEIMSEMTLENGLDAGNYTNLGRTELMDSCISKCCAIKSCEVAIQMDNVCFAVKCYSKESCKIKSTLGKSSHHKLCFISRKKKERQSVFGKGQHHDVFSLFLNRILVERTRFHLDIILFFIFA